MEIEPIVADFVGEVRDLDLREPVKEIDLQAINEAIEQLGVLVFHNQNITDEQQLNFSKTFGKLEQPSSKSNITKPDERRLTSPNIADVSNIDEKGDLFKKDSRRRLFNLANQLWHSDSSFRKIPAKFSLLSARTIASKGGNTEFADMQTAYERLDNQMQNLIENLICEHSTLYSRATIGFSDFSAEERDNFQPVQQRLVRIHPTTGRKSLFLSAHAGAIVGWDIPEARSLLFELNEHATQREFVYAHKWQKYDLVMWDNRQTMHRVRRYNDTEESRDMRRTTVAGDNPTV
tara:strand:- start:2807 stop:3679 length:873 start_codon:yes stop_codon:yes gene_type:complete